MKLTLAIAATLAITTLNLQATPVFLNSTSTANDPNQTNNQTGVNILITPNAAWHPNGFDSFGMPYSWISFTNSGEGATEPLPNAPLPITLPEPSDPTAIFYDTFRLGQAAASGVINVWADDTARVYMDDTLLIDADPVSGSACSHAPVGCTTENGFQYDLTNLHLGAGEHTLRIEAYQLAGSTFGVQYFGHIREIGEVPEPAALLLAGLGLIVLGAARRKLT